MFTILIPSDPFTPTFINILIKAVWALGWATLGMILQNNKIRAENVNWQQTL